MNATSAHPKRRRFCLGGPRIFPGGMNAWEKKIYMKWYRWVHDCPENRKRVADKTAKWKQENPDKVAAAKARQTPEQKAASIAKLDAWIAQNPNRRKASAKTPESKERRRQRRLKISGGMDKYYNDIQTRLTCLLRGRLYRLTSKKNFRVSYSMLELLGCTIAELRSHLESQFSSDMSWNNYGAGEGNRWQVDHIIACRRFTLEKTEHQRVCFHWTNLRPLWTEINQSKDSHPSIPKLTDAEVHAMHKKIWGDKIVSITQPNKAEQFPSEQSAQLGNT